MTISCRAYTGPAHGRRWTVPDGQEPDRIELPVDGQPSGSYRALRLRGDGSPVRDRTGNVIYLPVRPDSSTLTTSTGPRAYDEKVGNDDTG